MDTISEYDQEVAFLSRKLLDLNKQLIKSEQAKSRFLSLVASELNNPMTALLGLIPRLKPDDADPRQAIFGLVHQEALLLNFRIQNLVAAAQIESGELDASCASVEPETIVTEILEDLSYVIRSKNIILNIHNTLSSSVVTDPRMLYLILKNLIANACTYGSAGGIVEISLSEISSLLRIRVANQGTPPNIQCTPQLFTRFAEGPEGKHGLGIGLSIVRELCEQLEGSIDYTVEGEWVMFTVILPLYTDAAHADACGSNEFMFESFDDALEL